MLVIMLGILKKPEHLIINSSAQLSKLNPQTTLRHRILEYCVVNQLKSINDDRDQQKTEKCINRTNYVISSLRIYIYIVMRDENDSYI